MSKAKHNEDAINDEIQHHKTEIVQMKDKIKMLGEEIKVIQNERVFNLIIFKIFFFYLNTAKIDCLVF